MYTRNILSELENWKRNPSRKPLILRGARQVGKTTAVHLFGNTYKQYLYLNLEKEEDARPFRRFSSMPQLLEAIFFLQDKNFNEPDTLIFIDEIQEVPEAINLLRYFHEDFPGLHVIAAGSLLETVLNESTSVPVGRVEYRVIRPVAFDEFLQAIGETAALQQLNHLPLNEFAHEKLLNLFHRYTLLGGMPEIVAHYAEHRNLTALSHIYESLLVSYRNDVEKYARNSTMVQVIRHVIQSMALAAGSRIVFQGFGQSNYGSREVGEAMRTLEKAMLLSLVYPSAQTVLPILPDLRKSPRLQILDTGLLNFQAGIQKEVINATSLDAVYQGKLAEHIVGQELLAARFNVLHELRFWARDKKPSSAEVDFVVAHDQWVIPVEVKAGTSGKLRSLLQFMDHAPHPYAVRMYAGPLQVHHAKTLAGKPFFLLNLPYFLASRLQEYLGWFINQVP